MSFLRQIPLTGLAVEIGVYLVLAACLFVLVIPPQNVRRSHRSRHYLLVSAAILVVTVALGWGTRFLVESVWVPFPDKISLRIYAAGSAAIAIVVISIFRWRKSRRRRTIAESVLAIILAIASAATMTNVVYHIYPSLYSLFGVDKPRMISLSDVPKATLLPQSNRSLDAVWKPPTGQELPRQGAVVKMALNNKESHFRTSAAQVYLPPAYFMQPRPQLPVVVLLSGVPGDPEDWFSVGEAHLALDDWAANHAGLAPIVVAVDANGSRFHDTLCVDSKEGNALTYLGSDVPNAIKESFDVDPRPAHWAVAGLSRGGTCALQTLVNYPEKYGNFIDMSGELNPSTSTVDAAVKEYFDGDVDAYRAVTAVKHLTDNRMTQRFHGIHGQFIAGDSDSSSQVDLRQLHTLANQAGMDTEYRELSGGHTWQVWRVGFATSLDWLGSRLGITA